MIHVVILAGGSGTRFWPSSRESRPKQFLAIEGSQTMLRATVERILPLCGWSRMWLSGSAKYLRLMKKIVPELPATNLLLEPVARNTAPAIGFAAIEISRVDPNGIIIVLPSDHIVRPAASLRKLLRSACKVARGGALVTIGITPTRPETGYGYIHYGTKTADALCAAAGTDVFEVLDFVEKPDRPTAEDYLQAGCYVWNSGMFIFSAKSILEAIAACLPKLYGGLQELRDASLQAIPVRARDRMLRDFFTRIESISIDHGVMERTTNIRMLQSDFFWSDVGSWASLPEVLPQDKAGNVITGKVIALDSQGCVIRSEKRLVACIGLQKIVVVETPDAVLVCPMDQAQRVRALGDEIRKRKWDKNL
jgi:mannose-1-phosphate guanylyltransferase